MGIKVARKSNTKGLGQRGSHWGNDWWDRLYTQALDNVENKDNSKKEEESKKPLVFGAFTKAKSLNVGDTDDEDSSENDSDIETNDDVNEKERKEKAIHHMQDDDVFEACNNMILRKFVPVGKLERIAKQEQEWKEKLLGKNSEASIINETTPPILKKRKRDVDSTIEESPKKKRKLHKKSKSKTSKLDESEEKEKSKKKRKKKKKKKKKKKS